MLQPDPTPGFGQADLSNCEREQIQFTASIQPHGALLVVRETDGVIIQASENAADFLGLSDQVVGQRLMHLPGNLADRIKPHLRDPLHRIPRAVRCQIGRTTASFDGLLHRPPEGGLVIELERAGPPVDLSQHVESAVKSILSTSSVRSLCDETAKIFRKLTAYDRVMVYRFDDQGHGEILSEEREPHLEAFLGNRYPASDIPQIARRLYERNRVRVLVDVDYKPFALTPRLSPITGQDLDMSMCFLRSMSPIHIQYLKNMGVGATLVASLMVGGKLWGLVACHNYVPRFAHFEVRAVCELLAEVIGTRIAALESFVQAQSELSVRRLEQRMVEAISRQGDWKVALFDGSTALLQHVNATGAALLFEGQVFTVGDVPSTQKLREIGAWLDTKSHNNGPVVATASLSIDEPAFASIKSAVSGVLSTTVSRSPQEHLMWFRPEQIRTVTWGGDPHKSVIIGNNPAELSPRRSFAQWHQLVENTSETWTPADLVAARLIGESVADVVLQFRSVRMLIAQNQLEQVKRQVEVSDMPVLICDADGLILQTNDAFERLLPSVHRRMRSIKDLATIFVEKNEVGRRFNDLMSRRQSYRAEVRLELPGGDMHPLLLRVDPVFSTPDQPLGFVVLFTDLTERKAAEEARSRFQQDVINRHSVTNIRLDSTSDLVFQNMLSSVIDNAQLAALEITDGIDMARMPEMLESIYASVSRTAEVLEQLVWHSSGTAQDDT